MIYVAAAACLVCCKKEASEAQGAGAAAEPAATAAPAKVEPVDPTAPFLAWAAEHWGNPGGAGKNEECYDPPAPDAGWCESGWYAGDLHRGVKWRKTEPAALELRSETLPAGLRLSCADLAANEIRRWTWKMGQAMAELSHCKLASGPLAGQQVWIKNAPLGTYLRVFSAEYLNHDRDFADTLRTQGQAL